jgi:hypothetical protein
MKDLNFKKLFLPLVPIGAILIIISSCYPNNGDVYSSSLDTVMTLYDESVDYTQFKTYSMPDTIINVCDDKNSNDCVDLSNQYDEAILDLIAQNMLDLGYIRELDPETNGADLFLFVSKVATKNVNAYSYPWWGYWGWYPGWGYPGYPGYPGGGWNPWYPWGGTVVYTYTTGSVLLEMISTKHLDPSTGFANSVWAGGMNGLVDGSDIPQRLQKNINQMFTQSPYLKTN